MDKKEFRQLIILTARKAAAMCCMAIENSDWCGGYGITHIENGDKHIIIRASSYDGNQTDVFINGKYYTTFFFLKTYFALRRRQMV